MCFKFTLVVLLLSYHIFTLYYVFNIIFSLYVALVHSTEWYLYTTFYWFIHLDKTTKFIKNFSPANNTMANILLHLWTKVYLEFTPRSIVCMHLYKGNKHMKFFHMEEYTKFRILLPLMRDGGTFNWESKQRR